MHIKSESIQRSDGEISKITLFGRDDDMNSVKVVAEIDDGRVEFTEVTPVKTDIYGDKERYSRLPSGGMFTSKTPSIEVAGTMSLLSEAVTYLEENYDFDVRRSVYFENYA